MRTRLVSLAIFTAFAAGSLHAQNPSAGTVRSATPVRKPAVRVAPFGPQPGVTGTRNPMDLKTILYYAADALGMLRGPREVDWVLTMEFWGTGIVTLEGKPCKTTDYQAMVRYQAIPAAAAVASNARFRGESPLIAVPALRVAAKCAGTPKPQIQVVAGKYAWNEEKIGMNATPANSAVSDRLLQLWTFIPESVVKAATMAGTHLALSDDAGKPVLTFPMPEPLQSATMKVWINPKIFRIDTNPAGEKRQYSHLIERSELRIGDRIIDTTYNQYGDWNEEGLQTMILLPRRIVQKQNGVTTLDLTITKTDTFNPYIIMPIPASVAPAANQTTASRQ